MVIPHGYGYDTISQLHSPSLIIILIIIIIIVIIIITIIVIIIIIVIIYTITMAAIEALASLCQK